MGSGRRQCTGYCWPATVRDQYHQPPWKVGLEMSVSATRARICSNKRSWRRGGGGHNGIGVGVFGLQVVDDGGVVAVGQPVPVVCPGVAVSQVGHGPPGRDRGRRDLGEGHGGINYCATPPGPHGPRRSRKVTDDPTTARRLVAEGTPVVLVGADAAALGAVLAGAARPGRAASAYWP